jgi:cation diffusion facilitator family transporter
MELVKQEDTQDEGHTATMTDLDEEESEHNWSDYAAYASLVVNILLLGAKMVAYIVSGSDAILASLVDSCVDLISQGFLFAAQKLSKTQSPDYPVGRSRLDAIAVMACANIMITAGVQVIYVSSETLTESKPDEEDGININLLVYVLICGATASKFVLYLVCRWAQHIKYSETLAALTEDHLNDVMSNSVAIATAGIASRFNSVWWLDPAGAIFISLVIIYRWIQVILDWTRKIVGHTAPPEFVECVEKIVRDHDPSQLTLDCARIYFFGARYLVEVEVVLPGNMSVAESHAIALVLQHKIEKLDDVERAFVHVDHKIRDGLEHKVERQLANRARSESDDFNNV